MPIRSMGKWLFSTVILSVSGQLMSGCESWCSDGGLLRISGKNNLGPGECRKKPG